MGGRPLVISNSDFSFAELSVVHSHSVNEFWLDEGEYKRMYVSNVFVKVCQKLKQQYGRNTGHIRVLDGEIC